MNTVLTVRAPKVAHNSPPIEVQHIKSPKNPSTTYALNLTNDFSDDTDDHIWLKTQSVRKMLIKGCLAM